METKCYLKGFSGLIFHKTKIMIYKQELSPLKTNSLKLVIAFD